jgi:hypothetical protein
MPERWNARGARLVPEQPVDAGRHRCPRRSATRSAPPDVLLWTVPIRHDRFQTDAVGGAYIDANSLTHARDSHASAAALRIPFRILPSGFIH